MQKNIKDIVEQVSLKEDLDKEVLQSIANSVFLELNNKIKRPTSLIIYIKDIGKLYARKKKSIDGLAKIEEFLKMPKPIFPTDALIERKSSLEFLLKEYDQFLIDKNQHKNASNNNSDN